MAFERVLRKVYCEPWLILPEVHERISTVLDLHIRGESAGIMEDFGLEKPEPWFDDETGVAVIPVHGVVSKAISDMEAACGACDTEMISRWIDDAVFNDSVPAIVLDINSPGGTVSGVPELADQVRAARMKKPVFAFVDGVMASAAYWIGAGASAVYATQSSKVGSIGVFLPVVDVTKAYERAGFKVEMFKSGSHKAAGYPGTELTDEQRAEIQSSVDYLYGKFSGFVSANRPASKEIMDGRTFFSEQATKNGLVDSVVHGISAAIDDAVAYARLTK